MVLMTLGAGIDRSGGKSISLSMYASRFHLWTPSTTVWVIHLQVWASPPAYEATLSYLPFYLPATIWVLPGC